MHVLNRENAIALLKGMLAAQKRPVIHFIRSEEVLGPKQNRHTYRFFVINSGELFNISALITAAFAATVQDRSQAFSVNSLGPDDDLKQFWEGLQRLTELSHLDMVDLLTGANNAVDMTINPGVMEFFPDEAVYLAQAPRFPTNNITEDSEPL